MSVKTRLRVTVLKDILIPKKTVRGILSGYNTASDIISYHYNQKG